MKVKKNSKIKFIEITSLRDYLSLEIFLMEVSPSLSKKRIKEYLDYSTRNKNVFCGDYLTIPQNILNHELVAPIYENESSHPLPISIIYEDELLLVLNKPSQTHCESRTYDQGNHLQAYVREYFNGDSFKYKESLLHRLDFFTSGVLIFSKCLKLSQEVRTNFSKFFLHKEYYALVQGHVGQSQVLEHYLKSSGVSGAKVKINKDKNEGKFCSLKLDPISYLATWNISLVKVILHTGYRHQIRVQLSTLGHPIVGDLLYGGKTSSEIFGEGIFKKESFFLHSFCYQLDFNDEKREPIQLKASFPDHWKELQKFSWDTSVDVLEF